MVINLKIPWFRIVLDLKVQLILIVAYMSVISVADHYLTLTEIHVPISLISVPGTVIALLLGFRTNSAYDRWWEARIIWGSIVNDSRTWVRQLETFIKSDDTNINVDMGLRQAAWNYALMRSLRRQNPLADITDMIPEEECRQLEKRQNIPNAMLYTQAKKLKNLHEKGLIDSYQFVQLDRTLNNLTDSMGKCERIKNTIFPSG